MSTTNIRLLIAYDGTLYCGWQRQRNGQTIQGILEEKLSIMSGQKITVNGAGRTDSGVHALGMVANFKSSSAMSAHAYYRALNSMLPSDIRILDAQAVKADFHARYNSTGKTYRYDFFTGKIQLPHQRLYRAHIRAPFLLKQVQSCLNMLTGSHDFSSFEATGSRDLTRTSGRGATRTLFCAQCLTDTNIPEHYSFLFQGDGFLRHMVRNIAGTLFLAASGRISTEEFYTILQQKDRCKAGPTAPACGLFLQQVHYRPLAGLKN